MENVDLLVVNASELLTLENEGPKKGADLDRLDAIPDGAAAVREGRIVETGTTGKIRSKYRAREILDAEGGVVMPGFVDPHTHPVFGATREAEFDMRLRGKSYVEITQAGGGIFSSVRSLRETSTEELTALLRGRLDAFISLGTTTVEAKSGYGLNLEDEERSLEIIARCGADHPIDLVATFLGAHQVPKEYAGDRDGYIARLIGEIMPRIRRKGLAEYCDIFCEEGVYEIDESRRIMSAARDLGFKLRLHADELAPIGGAELAAELGASSADHLVRVSDAGIDAMAEKGVIPVILPGTVFSLNLEEKPPVRKMIEQGLPVALATDFNPGTSFVQSMPAVISIACCVLRMTVAEAVSAATVNAAWSLDRGECMGSLQAGRQADLLVLDCSSHLFLGYRLGWNPVKIVVKRGRIVFRRPPLKVG
jgi:imidazolonepropionase